MRYQLAAVFILLSATVARGQAALTGAQAYRVAAENNQRMLEDAIRQFNLHPELAKSQIDGDVEQMLHARTAAGRIAGIDDLGSTIYVFHHSTLKMPDADKIADAIAAVVRDESPELRAKGFAMAIVVARELGAKRIESLIPAARIEADPKKVKNPSTFDAAVLAINNIIAALGECGTPEASSDLIDRLNDDAYAKFVDDILRALGNCSDEKAIDALVEFKKTPAGKQRQKLLDSLIARMETAKFHPKENR
jgi:HEAT repeat protein